MATFKRDKAGRWRDAKGKFVSAGAVARERSRMRVQAAMERAARSKPKKSQRQKSRRREMRSQVRRTVYPAGVVFELTATTQGGSPKRKGRK